MSRLDALASELRTLLAELDVQLQAYEALREERSRVQRALNALDPPAPKPKPTNGHSKLNSAKLARLASYVREHPDEDLIASKINLDLENFSLQKIGEGLAELQSRGVVRLDRMINGGGKAYRLVA